MLIDAHHHLWDDGRLPHDRHYMAEAYLADVAGFGFDATVFM